MTRKVRGIGWLDVPLGAGCRRYGVSLLTMTVLAATLAMPSPALAKVTPKLTTDGGPVETEPHVYEIFWGSNWNSEHELAAAERMTLKNMYNYFNEGAGREGTGSAWQGILTQYWSPEGFVSNTLTIGTPYTDERESAPSGVDTAKMEKEVSEAITANKANGWPQEPKVNDLFVLFTAPGTTYSSAEEHFDCGNHYHTTSFHFAHVSWDREESGKIYTCNLTVTASHEYAESVTDPLGNGWKNQSSEEGEIADLCAYEKEGRTLADGIEVAKLWDNHKEKEEESEFESVDCSISDPKPPQISPEVVTEGTSAVTWSGATLEGKATPNGLDIGKYAFEWRKSESEKYKEVPEEFFEEWLWDQESEKVKIRLPGLESDTIYHYRLVIYGKEWLGKFIEVPGELKEFKTPYAPPIVKTGSASKITNIGATLSGTVNPKGSETTYDFEYGPTKSYGSKTPEVKVGSGTSSLEESKAITGLEPGVTYYFRMVATNRGGTGGTEEGNEGTFTTPETEWRQGGGLLSEPIGTRSKGTVKVTDEGYGKWECETTGEGSAGTTVTDEETKWGASKCTVVSGSCEASKGAALKAVHLPWHSELLKSGGSSYDVIASSGKGAPGYTIECTVGGILKVVDECTATTLKTSMANVAGGVDATFDGEKLNCSVGGTGKGVIEGTQLLEATKGGELEVTAPEWRQGSAKLSASVATKSKGTVKLTDEGHGEWECEATGEGPAGLGAVGEETKWGTSKCTVVSGSCEAGKAAELKAVNLPWHSELLIAGGVGYDTITSGGKGAPGYKVECTVGGILKVVDECTATTLKTSMTNTMGGVDATLDGEKLKCSVGGAGKGLVEGTQLLEAAKGGELEVTAPEWRQGGAKLSASVATKSKGTVKLTDEGYGEWECEGTGEGSVGLGAVDEETKWSTSKCAVIPGSCEAGKAAELKAVNLPWHSELLIPGGASYDMITTGGKGALGYKMECTVGGVLKVVDECTGTTLKTYMTDVTGGVDATFDGEKLKCSTGGAGKGTLEGTLLVEATKGGVLEAT